MVKMSPKFWKRKSVSKCIGNFVEATPEPHLMVKSGKNKNLNDGKRNKKDEFYTQSRDIEKELKHYWEHLKGKIIFCNCDDPDESKFWDYFYNKFDDLGLKKLIATHYDYNNSTYKQEYDGKNRIKTELKGHGDFRDQECIELLKEADIVITNPPFSLFREYVNQLMEYNKNFIIIGHQNNIGYKEIFPLIKDNKMWLGYGFAGGAAHFINKYYNDYAVATDHKHGMIRVSGVVWFTNLEIKKRCENLILDKNYNEEEYPKYDNYDAINVNKTKDIPDGYYGEMGVPITFMDKYNPKQFEILRCSAYVDKKNYGCGALYVGGKKCYSRIIIKSTYI